MKMTRHDKLTVVFGLGLNALVIGIAILAALNYGNIA